VIADIAALTDDKVRRSKADQAEEIEFFRELVKDLGSKIRPIYF